MPAVNTFQHSGWFLEVELKQSFLDKLTARNMAATTHTYEKNIYLYVDLQCLRVYCLQYGNW